MKRITKLCFLLVSATGIMTSCSRVDEEIETTETIPQPQEITSVSETEDTVSSETQTSIITSEPELAETSAEVVTSDFITEPIETIGESTDESLQVEQVRDVDIDLTQMSSTMVFAEVYNITTTPEDYQGKVIKMKGQFLSDLDTRTNKRYYACLILDATACCAEELGFVPKDGYLYPEDFPEPDGEITVTGTFDYFWENEYIINCRLIDADIEK